MMKKRYLTLIFFILALIVGLFLILKQKQPSLESGIIIQAELPWQRSGIYVKAGQKLTITATGKYVFRIEGYECGPEGIPDAEPFSGSWPANDLIGLALIGRIGENGIPFLVGGYAEITVDQDGELCFMVNDDVLDENSGSLRVEVLIERPQARMPMGILSAWAAERQRLWTEGTPVSELDGRATGAVGVQIGVDSKGRLHVVYTDQKGLMQVVYARSDNNGISWKRHSIFGQQGLPSYGPSIAIGPDDTLHIIYNQKAGLLYSQSVDRGESWSEPLILNENVPGKVVAKSLSVDSRGRVHIAFQAGEHERSPKQGQRVGMKRPFVRGRRPPFRKAAGGGSRIYYTLSTNKGRHFLVPVRLSEGDGSSAFPLFWVSGTSGERIVIPWRYKPGAGQKWEIHAAVSNDGGRTFKERLIKSSAKDDLYDPAAIVDTKGRVHLAYMRIYLHLSSIEYIRSEDAGKTWTAPRTLSAGQSRFPIWEGHRERSGYTNFPRK